jgi:hypothetical protein
MQFRLKRQTASGASNTLRGFKAAVEAAVALG